MATKGERVFAWVGVGVAVLSTVALSAAVIIQQIITDRQNAKNDAAAQSSLACVDNNTEQPLTVPAKYTVSTPVTALQVADLTTGTGAAAKAGDCLIVKYYGTLATDGTVFDENYDKTTAFPFKLGQGNVIQGWDQGLVGMKQGGERRLTIPSKLAYGSQSSGVIPANADLVFYVKLLRIQ